MTAKAKAPAEKAAKAKAPAEKADAAAPVEDAPKSGERRAIPKFTDRGDWQDPFVHTSEYLVYYADSVSEATGAVRDGDEAVYPDAA